MKTSDAAGDFLIVLHCSTLAFQIVLHLKLAPEAARSLRSLAARDPGTIPLPQKFIFALYFCLFSSFPLFCARDARRDFFCLFYARRSW
jgi:hypothetical protein